MRVETQSIFSLNTRATAEENDLFAAFVADLVARGRKPKTVESYRSDWLGLCDWWNSSHDRVFSVDVMGEDTAGEFKKSLVERSMTAATINRKLVFIKRYTDFARASGCLDEKQARAVRRIEAAPAARRRPQGLSDIELRRFLKEVESRALVRDQAIIFTLLQTGLKVSELVSLRREQIGLGAKSGLIRLDGDARGRARRVEVGPVARRRLRAWFDERGDQDGPIWEGERGPLTANAVQRLIRKYCLFAHVYVSPQVLRHTFAAGFLTESRGDLVGLADALGHECLETTRLYLTSHGVTSQGVTLQEPRPVALSGGRG